MLLNKGENKMNMNHFFASTIQKISENPGILLAMSVEGAKQKAKRIRKDVLVIKDGESYSHCDPIHYQEKGFTFPILATVRPDGTVKRGDRNINGR